MSIYIVIEIGYALSSAAYFIYFCIDCVIDAGVTFHAYFLYFFAIPVTIFMTLVPVALSFLSLDRCLSIAFPRSPRMHVFLGYCNIVVIIFSVFFIVITDIITAFPKTTITPCNGFGCMATIFGKSAYTVYRMGFGVFNVIISIILAIMIQRKLKLSEAATRINIIVFKTLAIVFLVDFVPHLVFLVFAFGFGQDLTKLYSPYFVVCSIDSFLVAFLYSRNIGNLNTNRTSEIKTAPGVGMFAKPNDSNKLTASWHT
uniref:G_PROTEIN_RECEP_F1_2 domain-containing protein n=1 Tax=Panagrellus redivivus TaxID=6233 RepID=A0A7E4ZTR9_PANRE